MYTLLVFLFFLGIILFIAFLKGSIYTVDQKSRAMVERFGQYKGYAGPGLHFKIPIIDKVRRRDIREDTIEIRPQHVITKDNVEISVDGVFWCRVKSTKEEVKKSFYKIDDYIRALQKLSQTNIREEFGKMNFDEALTSRQKVGQNLIKTLHKKAKNWGVDVTAVEIQTIDPPADIKKAMHKEKQAEQERRARRKEAKGEKEAAEQEKQAKILRAEGRKQSDILEAEGDAQAKKLRAEAEAAAIEQVAKAAQEYFTERAKTQRKLEVLQNTLQDKTKLILPTDSNFLNLLDLDSLSQSGKIMETDQKTGET